MYSSFTIIKLHTDILMKMRTLKSKAIFRDKMCYSTYLSENILRY